MPCSHCGQIGHNIRTCPQRNINIIGNVLETETVPIQRTTEHVKMNKYRIVNLQNTNYLIYWIVGNFQKQEFNIEKKDYKLKYIGLCFKNFTMKIRAIKGHKFYLIPHKINMEPPYHPLKISHLVIDPYMSLTINEGNQYNKDIYIDNKNELSELNKWRFNALKLDYLLKEIIKLGGKNYDTLEPILDLHQDIQIDSCSEFIKEIAGIPSQLTNII